MVMWKDKQKIVGASYNQSFVGLWVVDLKEVRPFGSYLADQSLDSGVMGGAYNRASAAAAASSANAPNMQDFALRRQGAGSVGGMAAPVGPPGGRVGSSPTLEAAVARGMEHMDLDDRVSVCVRAWGGGGCWARAGGGEGGVLCVGVVFGWVGVLGAAREQPAHPAL